MAIKRHRGISGSIEIEYDYRENPAGSVETEHLIELQTIKSNIVLYEMESETNFNKGFSSKSENRYEIKPKLLIELIKEHGRLL